MNRFIKAISAIMLMLSASITTCVWAFDETQPDITNKIQVKAFVDGLVIPQMKKNHSPSGVVTLMKGGKVIFSKGYGYQDIEKKIPVDPATTLFRPGSISKLFTWVSVMQQVEKGNIDLDADVNQYLRTFQIADTWPAQPVTLRHILSHTSGFEDGGLGYLLVEKGKEIVPLAQSVASYMPERVNPPGKHTAYSNWATALAGLIVANVSGIEFNQYVRQNIFDVLEMNSATFVEPLPENLLDNMAKSYSWKAGQYVEESFEIIANLGPSGSITASSDDMVRFAKAILGQGEVVNSEGNYVRILEKATVQQMLSRLHGHDPRTLGMAYGFVNLPYVDRSIIGHDGGTNVFLSHFGLSLEEEMMLFTSFSGPGAVSVHSIFKKAFYNYFFPSVAADSKPSSDLTAGGFNYAGTYQPWRANFTKIEKIVGALQSVKVSVMSDNTLLIGDTRYEQEDKHLFREVGGHKRIAFQEDEFQRISGYITDGAAVKQMYKAPFYGTLAFILLISIPACVVFISVILRQVYQGEIISALTLNEKLAFRASFAIAAFNLLFLILFILSFSGASNRELMTEFPWLLKFALIFPILALLATVYNVYQTFIVWSRGLGNLFTRTRLSVVSVFSLMMLWVYGYWNLIGFNYL